MAHFHVTAVLETRGPSQEDADRAAVAVFKSLRHPRVYFYEHDTSGGIGPFPPGTSLYFTTMAEFDIDAPTEEKAGEIADEVLDALSTEEVQYLGLGVIPGSQRVRPEQRSAREEERRVVPEVRGQQEEPEEHVGKGRRPRGHRRKRGSERESEAPEKRQEEEEVAPPSPEITAAVPEAEPTTVAAPLDATSVAPPSHEERKVTVLDLHPIETPPPPPPPRSSASMRVTLTVSIRASELPRSAAETTTADQAELIALAIAEARRRHPELPDDVSPQSAISPLPAGDMLLTLTWQYDRPVPSASAAE
jgi:hypothetical protein